MRQTASRSTRPPRKPEPTWDIAYLFPRQGEWTEEEYFALETNRLVELSNGRLELLTMPTTWHQLLILFLCDRLRAFVGEHDLGTVAMAALPVKLWQGKIREPDVLFMFKQNTRHIYEQFWQGADLVMEVVSGDKKSRRLDLVTKRAEYARARISEYWIVDTQEERMLVLRLVGKRYEVHGEFGPGTIAASHLLRGFSLNVDELLAVKKAAPGAGRRNGNKK